jgi:hypothetical protein
MILGLAAVALIVAFQTSITASSEHRNLSKVTAAISDVTATAYSQVRVLDASASTNLFTTQQSLLQYQNDFDTVLSAPLISIAVSAQVVSVQFWDTTQQLFPAVIPGTGESAFTAYQPQLLTVDVTNTLTKKVTVHGIILADPTVVKPRIPPGPASKLQFFVQPSGATLSIPFTTQPVVAVEDSAGNVITTALPYLTISISPGTGTAGAQLSSTCMAVPNGSGLFVYSDCSIDQLGSGYQLLASAPYVTSPTIPPQASAPFDVAPVRLHVPTITSTGVTPSTTVAGAIVVNFALSDNAPIGQDYVVTACTDAKMTLNCQSVRNFASGNSLTGLTPGSGYYVEIEAAASTGFIASTSPPSGPIVATVQLNAPTVTSLDFGTSAGSLTVNFTGSSNALSGQTYSALACDKRSNVCTSFPSIFTSPATTGQLTGLYFTPGSPGDPYTVTLIADKSPGYLASDPSTPGGPQADTSALNSPTPVAASSTTTVGAVTATFGSIAGTQPSSYSATACTDSGLSLGCVNVAPYVSDGQIAGLTPGTPYWVGITEVPPLGYVGSSATPVTSASSAPATIQLNAPSVASLGYGTSAGSLSVNFTGSSPASTGQTYSAIACSTAPTPVCTSAASITPGGQLTGLAYTPGSPGTDYTVTVSADASPGYLASGYSTASTAQADTSSLNPVTGLTATTDNSTYPYVVGIDVTFSAPTGPTPTSYVATACPSLSSSQGCQQISSFNSGPPINGLITGLSNSTYYYVQVTAVGIAQYASSTSTYSSTSSTPTKVQG